MNKPITKVLIPQRELAPITNVNLNESDENQWLFDNRLAFDSEQACKVAFNAQFRNGTGTKRAIIDGKGLTVRVRKICVRHFPYLIAIKWTNTVAAEEIDVFINQVIEFCVLNNITSYKLCETREYFRAFCKLIHRENQIDKYIIDYRDQIEARINKELSKKEEIIKVNNEEASEVLQKLEVNTTLKNILYNTLSALNKKKSEEELIKLTVMVFDILRGETPEDNNELMTNIIMLNNSNLTTKADVDQLVNLLTFCSSINVMSTNKAVMFE